MAYISGTNERDLITGSDENDSIFGLGDNDTIYAGAGIDYVNGGAGDDFIDGGNEGDYLEGNEGNDIIHGGDGHDGIQGGEGNDTLFGDAGDDSLDGGAGNDYLDGGTGIDIAKFSGLSTDYQVSYNADGSVTVTLLTSSAAGSGSASGGAASGAASTPPSGEVDYLSNIEYIQFSDRTISTNDAPHTYDAMAFGAEDSDFIPITLSGTDDRSIASFSISDLPANGTLYLDQEMTQVASADMDYSATNNSLTLYFKPDHDFAGDVNFNYSAKDFSGAADATPALATISVSQVNDAPIAMADSGSMNESMSDLMGNLLANDSDPEGSALSVHHYLAVGTYGNLFVTSSGDYTYTLNGPIDLPQGQFLTDQFSYSVTDGSLDSTAYLTITINGIDPAPVNNSESLTNTLIDGTGNTILNGTAGVEDTVDFSSSTDGRIINLNTSTATSVSSNEVDSLTEIENVLGSNFGDIIQGNDSNNLLKGKDGDDVLKGGKGDDTLDGGAGDDTLVGDSGNDILNGGDGLGDFVDYSNSTDGRLIHLNSSTATDLSGGEVDTLVQIENVLGTNFGDLIEGNDGNNILKGKDGDDILKGGKGDDTIFGDGGHDKLFFDEGQKAFDGGDGVDVLTAEDAQTGVNFDLANSIFSFSAAASSSATGGSATGGSATGGSATGGSATGGSATGSSSTATVANIEDLTGSDFSDLLGGNNLDNYLTGLNGNDTFNGRDGNDTIAGGEGNDTAIYSDPMADYTYTNENGVLSIFGPEGNDTLTGIETLNFSGANVQVADLMETAIQTHFA